MINLYQKLLAEFVSIRQFSLLRGDKFVKSNGSISANFKDKEDKGTI